MKILCVGRNYASHARETGAPLPKEPVWFWKPDSAVIADGGTLVIPEGIGAVHHEVELAIRLGRRARRATADEAAAAIDAFTVANDATARDLQEAAKRAGLPWARAKGFDTFLPLGPWQEAAGVDLQSLRLRLTVNGTVRQEAPTSGMTWPAARLVALASEWTTLEPGDVLCTGTPSGVGPMVAGDVVEAEIVGHVRLRHRVV